VVVTTTVKALGGVRGTMNAARFGISQAGRLAAGAGRALAAVASPLGLVTALAVVSVGLAAESTRAAIKGEDTPVDVADKFYGTHFGDIYGWVTGAYANR
jgi:hypothetical protein